MLTESGLMEKTGIEPAPGLQGIGLSPIPKNGQNLN